MTIDSIFGTPEKIVMTIHMIGVATDRLHGWGVKLVKIEIEMVDTRHINVRRG
jgi:hypothetical protein